MKGEEIEIIEEKVKGGQTLSFDDIRKIEKVVTTEDENTLDNILDILEKDVELRRKLYDTDPIKELYYGEEYFPNNLRLSHPRPDDIKGLIYEKIRALILHEYGRLHIFTGFKFINGEITYDEYRKRVRWYFETAHSLWKNKFL